MRLDELKPAPGSRHRRKIVGRGIGSGHGSQSTRGMKGQRSRAGFSGMTGFEGGQTPLVRRIPKRGFRHTAFRTEYSVVNVGQFDKLYKAKESVSPDTLSEKGLVKGRHHIKVLGDGDLSIALTVQAHSFSNSAKAKIEKAGGKVEILKR